MKTILYTIVLIGALLLTGCANAGKDQTVMSGDMVALDASASTASLRGEVTHYHWKQVQGEPVVLSGENTAQATFAAPVVTETTKLRFRLNTVETGGYICDEIQLLMDAFPEILLEKRGKGLMIGIEINSVENRNFLMKKFLEEKFLVLPSGEKTLRLLPPLIITPENMKNFWKTFKEILGKIS